MTAMELSGIVTSMPYDAEIRFVCNRDDNPHTDYYKVEHAYLLHFKTAKILNAPCI